MGESGLIPGQFRDTLWKSAGFSPSWLSWPGNLVRAVAPISSPLPDRVGRKAPPLRDEQLRVVAGNVDDFSDPFAREVDPVDRVRELSGELNPHLVGSPMIHQTGASAGYDFLTASIVPDTASRLLLALCRR